MFEKTFTVFFGLAFALCVSQSDAETKSSVGKPTTIGDLPFEIILMIYEGFNLDDLNAVAQLSPYHRHVAEKVFNKKYGKKHFKIDIRGLNIKHSNTYYNRICEIDTMYLTLKNFPNSITNLTIDYEKLTNFESSFINKRLSKYLANSLIDFELIHCYDGNLKKLTGPFHKVESVQFWRGGADSREFNLSKIFPMVRTIDVERIQYMSSEVIEHHFPHLIEFKENIGHANSDKLVRIFELNPQLRRLKIYEANLDFLKMISKTLPNLKSLEIWSTIQGRGFIEGEDIHFEHLSVFLPSMVHSIPDGLQNLRIITGNLEEIRFYSLDIVTFNIVVQNEQLKKLTLEDIKGEYFQRVAEELPHLEAIVTRVRVDTAEDVARFVRFVKAARNLKEIIVGSCAPELHAEIVEQTQSEWEMIVEGYTVTFLRRNASDANGGF